MISLLARLHGVDQIQHPDYGQNMPTLVKGGTAIGLAASGVVIGVALLLRDDGGYGSGQIIMLLALTVVALLAFGVVALVLWSSRRGKLLMRDRVVADLDLRGDEQILDVGCGNGLLLIGAAEHLTTGRATGVDVWRQSLESNNSAASVRQNAALAGVADRIDVEDADARDLPFEDATFDVVLSSLMLHHMSTEARQTAIGEMLRTLKPGGRLVIVEVLRGGGLRSLVEGAAVASVGEASLGLPFYKRLVAVK